MMGLGLAIVGLYGLVAYAAARRTREIGIRMAIGATRADGAEHGAPAGAGARVVGLAVGLVASIGAGQLLDAAFPSLDDRQDIVALLLVAPVVFAVTMAAAYLPARRASRINPMEALRNE